MLNSWKAGAYAQQVNVPIDELVAIPNGVEFEQAAGVPLVALTALQALRDNGKLKPGQHVLINGGSGGVGTAAIQIAKAMITIMTAIPPAKIGFFRHSGTPFTKRLLPSNNRNYMTKSWRIDIKIAGEVGICHKIDGTDSI